MAERWRAVPGWADLYEVSDQGRVRSLQRGGPRLLRPQGRRGYLRVALTSRPRGKPRRWRPVHQLVLEAFHGPRPLGQVARHLNGDRTDNRADNLAWGFPADNVADRVLHSAAGGGRIPPETILQAAILRHQGLSWGEISARLGWRGDTLRRRVHRRYRAKEAHS